MKLYRTYATYDTEPTTTPTWSTSQAVAATQRKHLYSGGHRRENVVTEEVDVPAKKQELCEWLNQYAK